MFTLNMNDDKWFNENKQNLNNIIIEINTS